MIDQVLPTAKVARLAGHHVLYFAAPLDVARGQFLGPQTERKELGLRETR